MVRLPSLTTIAPRFAAATVVLRRRFRRPVRYRMPLVLTGGQPPGAEPCGSVEAFDRARRPSAHLCHPNIRGEAVQDRFMG